MFAEASLIFLPILALLFIPLGLAMLAFWIWMLVHSIQNKGLSDSERIAWVLVIAFLHFLGAIIYFFAGRPKAKQISPIHRAVT
jgi:hypothetical protein